VAGEEGAAAGNVQRAGGRQRRDQADQADHVLKLGMPARSFTLGEAALAQIPLIVLSCPLVVVRRSGRVPGEGWVRRRHRPSLPGPPLTGSTGQPDRHW